MDGYKFVSFVIVVVKQWLYVIKGSVQYDVRHFW